MKFKNVNQKWEMKNKNGKRKWNEWVKKCYGGGNCDVIIGRNSKFKINFKNLLTFY